MLFSDLRLCCVIAMCNDAVVVRVAPYCDPCCVLYLLAWLTVRAQRVQIIAEIKEADVKLALYISATRALKQEVRAGPFLHVSILHADMQIEKDLAQKYKGRQVNLIGDVNTI